MTPLRPHTLACAAALALAALPALALYKVVGPDGSITYTDRAPGSENSRVSTIRRDGSTTGEPTVPGLPTDLREAAQKFPVLLYTSADCSPCEAGRKLLAERGVPYTERRIASQDDLDQLARATGVRAVPVLSVGAQVLRGFGDAEWHLYLDTAGYPRESKLPRGWQPTAATTLTTKKAPAAPPPKPAEPPVALPEPDPLPTPAPGLRF